MYYLYCLESLKNHKLYIGFTTDLKKRFVDHNNGDGGNFTSHNRPWKLIYYEAYCEKKDAQSAEEYYKTGQGRGILRKKLQNYFRRGIVPPV